MRKYLLAVAALWVAGAIDAHAAFHLFRIDQIYSNSDGEVQYIVLKEGSGANNEDRLASHPLTAINTLGIEKQIVFPSNLASTSTANRSVLIATPAFAALGIVTPDYTIPARFIPTDGGMLDYAAGTDRLVLPVLPTDGVMAIDRVGNPVTGTPRNFANASGTMTPRPATSIEFYNQSLDHYFISALAPDIDALDSGRFAGWVRTGQSFTVYPSPEAAGAGATAVCRIIIPPPYGDSHFFGRSAQECGETLSKFPFMSQETPNAFYISLPTAGVCPPAMIPVYRAFSNRADANHRYTMDRAIRDQMVSMGWTAEGDGPDLVVMCAPSSM
jgi:hypothetical protein